MQMLMILKGEVQKTCFRAVVGSERKQKRSSFCIKQTISTSSELCLCVIVGFR